MLYHSTTLTHGMRSEGQDLHSEFVSTMSDVTVLYRRRITRCVRGLTPMFSNIPLYRQFIQVINNTTDQIQISDCYQYVQNTAI